MTGICRDTIAGMLQLSTYTTVISAIIVTQMATNPPGENAEQAQQLPNGTQPESEHVPPPPAIPESRLPTRKDTSLKELLNKMDDYAPIVRSFLVP